MLTRFSPAQITTAVTAVATRIATETPQIGWRNLSEEQLWAELVGCILSSQVRHESCSAAHERLTRLGLLNIKRIEDFDEFYYDVHHALSRPFTSSDNAFSFTGKYRFPKTKSEQIVGTATRLFHNTEGKGLSILLYESPDFCSARRKLITLCRGIGPKQASLFLRNVGFSGDVAVLDAHVMRYMEYMKLLDCPRLTLSSMRNYEKGEHTFRCHAWRVGFTPAVLDTAVWVVMRTISGEV
jgi:N-glycosylase/DNA lyase